MDSAFVNEQDFIKAYNFFKIFFICNIVHIYLGRHTSKFTRIDPCDIHFLNYICSKLTLSISINPPIISKIRPYYYNKSKPTYPYIQNIKSSIHAYSQILLQFTKTDYTSAPN